MDMAAEISKPKTKRLNAHAYIEMLKLKKANRVKQSDLSETKKLPQSEVNQDDTNNACGSFTDRERPKNDRLDFVLRQVRDSDQVESTSPDHGAQTKKRKKIREDECNLDTFKQKQKLAHFVESECKSTTSGFVEYWVPVQLSNIQIEQYCGSLFSNALTLCSSAKQGLSELLGGILLSIRKCCDHPYLVDLSLRNSLIQGLPEPDRLDAEIKLSNKLLLLYKILEEIRNRGLRVLILYKLHEGSGPISTGDILDDLIDKKFGKDSLERISEKMSSSKRQERLKIFNEKLNEKFVCLMETRACIPSMELLSTDCVIIFNSDLDPMHDLRSLQKVKLDSQFEQVKIFRLYSSHTVEEKVLLLAKQSIPRRGNMINMAYSAYHRYLSWGALYLFKRLDEFHSSSTDAHSLFSSEKSFVEDVLLELSELLPNNDQTKFCSERSFVTEVQQIEGHYRGDVSLLGDVESPLMENFSFFEEFLAKQPRDFWRNLLEGRDPRWKYVSSQSPRSRRAKLQQNKAAETTSMGPQSSVAMDQDVEDSIGPLEFSVEHSMRELPVQTPCVVTEVTQQTKAAESTSTGSQSLDGRAALGSKASLNCQSPEVSPIDEMVVLQSVYEEIQFGLERLQKQEAEHLKVHKDKKVQLKLEYEKEIEETRKRYDMLLQNAEMAFSKEKGELETRYDRLHKTKSLVEIMMKKATAEDNTPFPVTKNCNLEEPGSSIVTRPVQFPGNHPNIASTSYQMSAIPCVAISRNFQTDYAMRAPAPHLRQMLHRVPVTTPQPSIPDERVIFSPVNIPKVASTVQNQQPRGSALKLRKI